MQNNKQLARRFREVILDGTWIANTNFKHQIDGMDWKIATTQVADFNTISLLAQHIHYYIEGMLLAFKQGKLEIKDKFSFEFPPMESQQQWDDFLSRFWSDSEEFASLVEQMSDKKLSSSFIHENYGNYFRNIDAMIEHSYYHLGQISLINKVLKNNILI